jgi:L-galactose dehydrogenase/L-glyceraldehyde 3-phosphate reductase
MKYRTLGKTGIEVSEIVFGAGAVGGLLIRADPATRVEAVRRALDHGVNWIDTAPSYGDGQSEENLGAILKELGATPYLSTKVAVRPPHLADIRGEVQRSMEASLGRLGRDSVDLITLHTSVTEERGGRPGSLSVEDVLGDGGVVDAFERLREQGLTRFFGFTAGGEADSLHRLIESGRFHAAQVFHSLVNPSAGRNLPPGFSGDDYKNLIGAAAEHDVGVFNIRVLAAGAVVGPEAAGRGEATPGISVEEALERMSKVRDVLEGEEGTVVQKAVRFALTNRGISGVLVGFSTLEHIDEAVASVDMGDISPVALGELDALFANF